MSDKHPPPPAPGADGSPRFRGRVSFFERVWTGEAEGSSDELDGAAVDVANIEEQIRRADAEREKSPSPFGVRLRHREPACKEDEPAPTPRLPPPGLHVRVTRHNTSEHEWYSEYSHHTLTSAARHDLVRSNSEYDSHIAHIRDEQERVQKKTFVNWINSYLSKRIPPLRIDDLIHDLRDGTKLLALLELLSGERLPTERGRVLRRPHFLSNANTALRFLAGKRIKLVNINAADLVDGRPAVVLGLIWTIILYFQIEENSRALEYLAGSRCVSVASVDSGRHTPTHAQERWKLGARKTLLQWVANALPKDSNIQVTDFGPSWRDGIAFLAIIDAIKANLINLAEMKRASNRQRLEHAFHVAESQLGIARLLDAEDVDVDKPDERSIMTYVAQFLHKYPEPKTTGPDAVAAVQEEYETLRAWLQERLAVLQRQYDSRTISRDYRDYARSEAERLTREPVYSKLEKLMHSQSLVAIAPKSWREMSALWSDLELIHRRWLWLLDSELPGDFRAVGEWLARAEQLLFFDEVPEDLDERSAAIISEKIEEHGDFFANLPEIIDRFENALRSSDAGKILPERLRQMRDRLDIVALRAPRRKAKLKYLEHKCCIVAFTNLTKTKLATWTDKYGNIDQVRALLEDYANFVTRNRIFQEFDRAYVDIRQVAEEYKRICEVNKTEARDIDSFLKDVAEMWHRVSSDVRCAQSVLEEVISYWERWTPLTSEFSAWLDRAQTKLRVSEDERLLFFEDITVWKERHRILGDCASFLAATCSDEVANEVKHKYVDLSERWERIFNEAKQYMHSGDVLRHRRDYAAGVLALSTWLREAEHLLNQQPRAHTDDIKLYGEKLLKLQSELENTEELFKNVSKSFQSMIADLPREEVDKNMATLKHEKEALVRVRAQIPVKLHLYHQLLVQHESLESGQREINSWLDKAEDLLSDRYNNDLTIIEKYETHKSFFSRITYYKSMLESKNKVFQNIMQSVNVDKSADVTESEQTMKNVNNRFARVARDAHERELQLQRLARSWDKFAENKKAVQEWVTRADALLADRHVDSKQAIDYHKNFFTRVDDKLIQDLVQSGKELLNCAPAEQQHTIVENVESLQQHWREVLARAPLHLMRLEFRLDETVFQQYIKDIEKEINYEQQIYNQTDDADGILIRNEEYFRNQGKVLQVERCLQNLKKISSNYEQQVGGDSGLTESLVRCERQWAVTVGSVEEFRARLQRIPAKWDVYRQRFRDMLHWMDHVDRIMDNIVREVDSSEAFEREKTIFQTICREADCKREDMKWLVQNLDLLSNHCPESEAQEEQNKLENLISRYKNLIPTIEITMIKTETYTRCYTYRREVHEVMCILEQVREQCAREPEPVSLQQAERLVAVQQSAVQRLDQQRPRVMSALQRGKELLKDANAPAFVHEQVSQLESGWSDVYNVTAERLHRLRDTHRLWSDFEYQKEDLLSDIESIENYVAHPGLEIGVSNMARELQDTRVFKDNLHRVKSDKLTELKKSYSELISLATDVPKQALEKDIVAIEHKVEKVQESVDNKIENLEKFNDEWQTIESKLDQVRDWIKKESAAFIHHIQSQNVKPDDRLLKTQELQKIISEKLEIIHDVADQGAKFASDHCIQDTSKLKNDVVHLEKIMADIKKSAENQSKIVEHDLANWQKYQNGITELRPWVEEAECKLANLPKPANLPEAEQLQQHSKILLNDCDKQLMNLQILSSVSHQLTGKTNASDEVDAIHSRWAVVHDLSDQWCGKLDKLVVNWRNFENEAEKLEAWIHQGEKLINIRPTTRESSQIEKMDQNLNQLKSFANEISQQQAKIITISQISDAVCHGVVPEGTALIKNRVSDIKQRTNALADAARSRINELSDKIISRQEFQTKLHTFNSWISDFKRKIESYDQVDTDRVEPALQCMHVLLQEHAEKAPVFGEIYNEVKDMTLSSTPEESKVLNEAYSDIAHKFQDVENHIQNNRTHLQKWSEFLNWLEDSNQQLNHIQYQIDGPSLSQEQYLKLNEELESVINKIPDRKKSISLLDESNKLKVIDQGTGRVLSPNKLLREIEIKAETLLNHVNIKKDLIHKVGVRWNKFNCQQKKVADVVQAINFNLNEVSQKALPLTKESIEKVSGILDNSEITLKENQNIRKELREEGLHLMRDDQSNMATVQNILSASENSWDQALNGVRDTKIKYTLLLSTLQELTNFEAAFEREIERAEQLYGSSVEIPNDFIQTSQLLDKSKKGFEILKRSKNLLEQMDVIKQSVLKQATSLGGFNTIPLEEKFMLSQTRWEKDNDAIIKRIQDLDSQLMVWRQIDETKNQVIMWLSETGQNLANATENLDIRYGQSNLLKYKEELPLYTGLKKNITAKCEQIENLNKNIPASQVMSIVDYLDNEFSALSDIADNLENALSNLEQKETGIKSRIKHVSDAISKIRDDIIKCDDMTGDNNKILERLNKCQTCKNELQNYRDEIENLLQDVSEISANYPGFYESLIPKELHALQKRFESVLMHENKTEATLLSFLKKIFNDKLVILNRAITHLDDKITWCEPELNSDKYNLEVKIAALNDIESGIDECKMKFKDLQDASEIVQKIDEPTALAEANSQTMNINEKLRQLAIKYKSTQEKLESNIDLWQEHENMSENLSQWLKQMEQKVRVEVANLIHLHNVDKKINEIKALNDDIKENEDKIKKLVDLTNKITSVNPDCRIQQFVNHLVTRHESVSQFVSAHLKRIQDLKANNENYKKCVNEFQTWLESANSNTKELAILSKNTSKPSLSDLEQVTLLCKDKENGQRLLNNAIEAGESLLSCIIPESREEIRTELRGLRDSFEESVDNLNKIVKDIENSMNKRSSFDDTFNQVSKWVCEKDKELGNYVLSPTLQEKKSVFHSNKILLQDVNLHENVLSQLSEKIKSLSDEETEKKFQETVEIFHKIKNELQNRVLKGDSCILEHEKYLRLLENCRDKIHEIVTQNTLANFTAVLEKEDAERKIKALEGIEKQGNDVEGMLKNLKEQQDLVLQTTHSYGHSTLTTEYDKINDTWNQFTNQCRDQEKKLKTALEHWIQDEKTLDDLEKWLFQKENQVRDQSLKNSLEAKLSHLEKIKSIYVDLQSKTDDFSALADKICSSESDSGLPNRTSKILTRYHTLINTVNDNISKYEGFVLEHKRFDKDSEDMEKWLKDTLAGLENLNEIVGDYAVLQDKQIKAKDLFETRNSKSAIFEDLLGLGEKLYSHTSPDGRDIIRQKIRNLRTLWDTFGDNFQDTINKLDQCLLQFSDFSLAQEQLTKWLKDVEKAMQKHTELKSSLEEKKAQLQNHKLMHQEIMTHQALVESVCDKAQQLVDQTHDASLNVYLESIKQLFKNIVSKSQTLQENLEECVKKHEELIQLINQFKEWHAIQAEKIIEIEKIQGEKPEIINKLETATALGDMEKVGSNKLDNIILCHDSVSKSTSELGNTAIKSEIDTLQAQLRNTVISISDTEEKLKQALKNWNRFDTSLESTIDWLKQMEKKCRDQSLCSDLAEKEIQLEKYCELHKEISSKEREIEFFVDESNNLMQSSGVERIKPLITQISSRYQQLHIISKEIINHWTNIVSDHKKYVTLSSELNSWLTPLEQQLELLAKNDEKSNSLQNKGNKLQVIMLENDNGERKFSTLTTVSDKILPDTTANGREIIRNELRELRERWDKLIENVLQQQKDYESQSQQWTSYQDILQQTLSWLDEKEKNIDAKEKVILNSAPEIKTKILKNKTLLQEIQSHKRVIEVVTEKAKNVANTLLSDKENSKEMLITIKSIWERYNTLISQLAKLINNQESSFEIYQQFADQQKSLQDYQKNTWEKLNSSSALSGNKAMLQAKLAKIQELIDTVPTGNNKVKIMTDYIEKHAGQLSPRGKEAMARELTVLKMDLEKFTTTVHEVKQGLEDKIRQWNEFESMYSRLQNWLNDTEINLKSYTPQATLEEKIEQLNKYQGVLGNLKKSEVEFDRMSDGFNDLVENCNDARISMNLQQTTSRFQSVQSTAKEVVKKCEQAVSEHSVYQDSYRQCSDWLKTAKNKYTECQKNPSNTPESIQLKRSSLNDLLSQRQNATVLVNNTFELGEKIYPSTSAEGKEIIEQQLEDLQQSLNNLFDDIMITEHNLDSELNKWSSFEENLNSIKEWLNEADKNLPKEIELKSTLDEKRAQLQVYRSFLQDALAHQQDINNLENRQDDLPDKSHKVVKEIESLKNKHDAILKRSQAFVEQYEAIVNNHQQYTKAVMDLQEWVEATHNTAELWGDVNLERVALCSNCEKLKSLQLTLPEEKSRIEKIRSLGEKVLPGTLTSGQKNIQNQIDSSHQEWEGLVSFISNTINSLEAKMQQWNEYEHCKDQLLIWIRNTDTKIHAVDLKSTLEEKRNQFDEFKELQGEVRAKELEIDNVTEKAQSLYTGVMGPRLSQISDISVKYQQLSHKVKELSNRWQQYVKTHQEFTSKVAECSQWFEDLRDKLDFCADLSACSQDDLETKLVLIQNLLLCKDDGFVRIQALVELAQNVLANTAPVGHAAINDALTNLQEQWSALLSKMIETKNVLDESITVWAGFLEQTHLIEKNNAWIENSLIELEPYQSTMTEKRAQLEKIKEIEEKARCEKIEVDNLKSTANEMLTSGQQTPAALQAQDILNRFDTLYDKIKKLLAEREAQYRDHRLYKEASDDLIGWLSRAREKVPSLKSKTLSDKLAIENSVAPLESLINKQAQGELLLEHLQHTGEVVLASTSPEGQTGISNEMKALRESFDSLFNEIKEQKLKLEETVGHWRDYKDEYERLSDWMQQKEIIIKNHKILLLGTLDEKENQVKAVKEVLDQLIKGKNDMDKFNSSASSLLASHLESYVTNQLRHLNSRYQVLLNMANDVFKKVKTNHEQHKEYEENYEKTKEWLNSAWEITRGGSDAAGNTSKEILQKRLEQIEDLLKRREEGQNLVHSTVNNGEKVLRNTRSDGKEKINTELKELQSDWDRLVKKMNTAKVLVETSLLQWADYSSSYSQLQQWINDREAKLQEVCEQKVAKSKRGQERLAGLATGLNLGERKATLRQTNNIVQDIVAFEPMIQSVTSKASELMQQAPATEITAKYETLTKQAKDLYEKQKEAVEKHQAFIDAGSNFVQWIRAAKERLGKCSEATGDKESLSNKMSLLTILESELPEGQTKLQKALEQGEISCASADDEHKEEIEEEVGLMQEEYDTYVENLNIAKSLIENGIVKLTEYEEKYKEALDWLSKTEQLVQSYNKLQKNLELKKSQLEKFQGHLQTLFDWQSDLDKLNVHAQALLETCADTRISNGVTQITTKYNALLSLAKEVMKRLELHYQEHQQHNALYGECQDWLDRTREKLNQCALTPNSPHEVNNKLNTVKLLRQSLEQGQNKLRYLLELKDKVIMNTEQSGAAKIQEDTDALKLEFDKLLLDIQEVRNKLASRGSQFDDLNKLHKCLLEWLDDMERKVQSDETLLDDLSEKKAKLEKFKTFQRDIDSHGDTVEKLKDKLKEDSTMQCKEIEDTFSRYNHMKQSVHDIISKMENQVKIHDDFKKSQDEFNDWVRNCKIEIQQCSDSHGEKEEMLKKKKKN